MSVENILEDWAEEAAFATAIDKHPRTVARYRNCPDGLPYIKLGKTVYIHLPTAKEWMLRRIKRRNPIPGMEGGTGRTVSEKYSACELSD